jgi:hypothetical protein
MEVLTNYKVELARRGKKIRDLSEAANINYDTVIRTLNGYRKPDLEFDMAVLKVFEMWDLKNEKAPQ